MEVDGLDGEINGETVGTCLSSYVDEGTMDSHRYYLARRTMLEMLRDRGFIIPPSEINLTLQDFRSLYGPRPEPDCLRVSTSLQSDNNKKMLGIFCGPMMIKVSTIRGILTQLGNTESLTGLILVVQNQVTNQAMKSLDLLPFKVEVFQVSSSLINMKSVITPCFDILQITDLLVNITKHVLKPKHRVLTDKEKQKLLKQYNLDEKQLPRMSQKDAVAKYYGLEKGQVVKVAYSGDLTQSHVTYRCVWG
ncbi:hypothetical protein V2J09_017745 [Rumex salicifolius]